MNRAEILELLLHGENSGLEFKRDDVRPERVAREIVALLNLEGGHILLGVEDDGAVSGLTREPSRAEEWVMQIARDHVQPPVIPYWETLEWGGGKIIGIVSLPTDAPDKPYKVKRGASWVTQIRVGTTTRDASREEEERLYQQSGRLRYGIKPVLGTSTDSLDTRRLRDYFVRVRGEHSFQIEDTDEYRTLLCNLELATESAGYVLSTVDGMLLFGENPGRYLPQSGIRAICYVGREPDYAVRADEDIKGPLVPLGSSSGPQIETGIVDRAWDFVRRNTIPRAWLEGARKHESWEYPEEAVREVLVNSLVHRDYSISGTDTTLSIFSDRMEVRSPGRLPNTVTIDGMKSGMRYARNQTLVNVMRDYGYVDARGMGIRNKVIPSMFAHNGTEPELIEEDYSFTVRLWKEADSLTPAGTWPGLHQRSRPLGR